MIIIIVIVIIIVIIVVIIVFCGSSPGKEKEFILYLFEIPLVDPLTLTFVLSLFNPYINLSSQSSH